MMKVGYLGPGTSTYGYTAAEKFFQGYQDVEFVPLHNHTEVCKMAGNGEIDFGVAAVENVINGIVTETIYAVDNLRRSSRLWIYGEVQIPVEFFFLSKGANGQATKLAYHSVARGQCSRRVNAFLKAHPGIVEEQVDSNAKAAKMASEDPGCVAVSNEKSEQEYGLTRIEPGSIANNPKNGTRFWIIGTQQAKRSDADKTCFLVNLNQDVPGGVYGTLGPFYSRHINLLHIAPIPIHGRQWEYSFLVEFSGSFNDPIMQEAYDELCESGVAMGGPLLIGSYPSGTNR